MAPKLQTKTITLPAGTPKGTYEEDVTLDKQYEQCVGVTVYESKNGGVPNYKIGLKDSVETYQEKTHKNDWICGPEVAPNQRYKSFSIPVTDEGLTIRTEITEVLATEMSYDIVFKLDGRKTR